MRVGNVVLCAFCLCASVSAFGQVQPNTNNPAPAAQNAPFSVEIRKTVVFIRTNCVHVPTPDELATMPPGERDRWTIEGISRLSPWELARLKQDSYFGTGFIVVVPDDRVGKGDSFQYLVTNRHVAQPGIEDGKPCKVVSYAISVNHLGAPPGSPPYLQSFPVNPENFWFFPEDDSVDLAVANFSLSASEFDFKGIPLSFFVTQEMIQKDEVVEGDPVIFTGLFVQYSGVDRLEPVVRTGAIAMLPTELAPTTLRKSGHVYFVEAHAYGGNSGSPVFVDVNRFKSGVGFDYHFLGVVAGWVPESSDLTLRVTTTYSGSIAANSNISVVIPASQLSDLLLSKPLQQMRDAYVAQHPLQQPTK